MVTGEALTRARSQGAGRLRVQAERAYSDPITLFSTRSFSMKRSKSLSLFLMGSLAVGASGCSKAQDEESIHAFTSVQECATSGLFTEAECIDMERAAREESPTFANLEECEAQYGAGSCSSSASSVHGGGIWMPMMMGFMAGRMMGNVGMMRGSQGLYRDTAAAGSNAYRTAGGDSVRPDAKGRVTNPSPRLKQSLGHNAKPAAVRSGSGSKGGFFNRSGASS